MKKLITMLLAVIFSFTIAADLIPGERVGAAAEPVGAKEYNWYTHAADAAYIFNYPFERATYINVEEFGLTYPVNFNGVQSYLYDAGIESQYKIYDRDGVTVLWDHTFTTAEAGYQIESPAAPMILNNDFWIVHVPTAEGLPRIVFDDASGPLPRSYFGSAGNWTSLYDVWADNSNYMMYVSLEQYAGADITPPSLRFVTGTTSFMDADAQIVLALTDESMITSVVGEYTLDGTTWNPITMTASKVNYYEYKGVIPGQVDGTEGLVRFVMTDEHGNAGTSYEYPISWSKDNPILSEGFEYAFPPEGWTLQTTGAGFIQVADDNAIIHQVHSGGYAAAHMDDSGPQDDWLISPVVSVPADNSTTLTFWQNGYWLNYVVDGYHEVAVSTDMTTWDVIYTGHPPVGNVVGNVWEQLYLSLSAYAGQDIYIGFHYVAEFEDQWFIDDVEVLYDYEGPVVVDLVGNEALYPVVGAFLNNDMNLSVTVNDLSGVQSVTGHYSFDEGVTVIDLPFTKAKGGDEVWTATIPAEAAVDSGYINFDMTDIGGVVSPTSDDYRIDFVLDTDPPVFDYVKGTSAFVNDPMNLEIYFSDESAITSCTGYFSPTGMSWIMFEMNPSKIHDYVYAGSIAAQSSELFDGQVYFSITDVEGNTLDSDIYFVNWYDGQNTIVEDFESGAGNWTFGGDTAPNWAIVAEGEYTSPINALTESPGGDYAADEVTFAQWATPIDLTAYPSASLSFWTKYDLEDGFDYMYLEGSRDGGTTWITLETFNGEGIGWHEEKVAMDAFAGESNVTFRFLFESDGGYETEGMYIDDLVLTTYNIDHAPPSFIADPYRPLFYEGVVGDYTDAVEVLDYSGVNQAAVSYTVDGGAAQVISATNTTGDFYEFTIPQQTPGSQVDYKIMAEDASPQANFGESKTYSYISGDHMVYDEGIVSYYQTIEDNAAKAVKVTVPGSGSGTFMTGKLSYILFRNYADATHISEAMEVHVWDDNEGVPGADLVTPFDVTSEASSANTSAMTRVDMRSYDLSVTGDFWVGVASPNGIVYLTMESTDPADASETEIGTTAFERSYTGAWDAGTSTWNWTLAPLDNWHFRAVLDGAYVGIDGDENVPMTTELLQNYPNPFNPATTINFNLAKDAKVSLVVYDVMGREVANLVNGEMSKGSHKVTFDASRLVSGVYYYNLKAGDLNQTKKMMLIK